MSPSSRGKFKPTFLGLKGKRLAHTIANRKLATNSLWMFLARSLMVALCFSAKGRPVGLWEPGSLV